MFKSSRGFTVQPPAGDGGSYLVSTADDPIFPAITQSTWIVDTLADECSCAAIQGIACDHKAAVDEYVEATASQITEEAKPRPDLTTADTASHRPTYTRKQIGTTDTKPPRPLWATDVECSCGWTNASDVSRTKDEAKDLFREHRDTAQQTTPAPIFKTREEWLTEATRHIHARAALLGLGDNPPKVRVACGFTYGKGRRIGECWRKEQSGDGTFEIIVHNKLDNPVEVLAVIVHEIGHTFMEQGTGHKAPFRRWAVTMGLAGPMTATTPGDELALWLKELAATLGTYPHAALDSARRIREGGPKRQTNRWLKYTCDVPGCGWIVRAAKADFSGLCVSPQHFDPDDPGRQVPGRFVPAFTTEIETTPEEEGE
jgi:hypothetical protein